MSSMRRWSLAVVAMLGACGGDPQLVAGSARVLSGPSTAGISPRIGVPPVPADGRWALTPDKAKLTFAQLSFTDFDGRPSNVPLTDCAPIYDKTSAALTELLDCPFDVPAGTYGSMSLSVSTTYEMILDDAVNGFFTTGSGVATTSPGTPQFSSFTVSGPGGMGDVLDSATYFSAPLVVDEANPVSVDIVIDMVHMLGVDVSGGNATVDVSAPSVPAMLVPSVSGAGRSEFYSRETDPGNMHVGPPGSTGTWGGVRVFFAAPPQPSFLWYPLPGPSEAYNVDPAKSPPNGTPYKAGGYLGVDSTNTMCWAMAANDYSYTSYDRLCKLPLVTGGMTTTLSCQTMSSVPAPTSGDTYASGCPTITPNVTLDLKLIAR